MTGLTSLVGVARAAEGIAILQIVGRTADRDAMVSRACEHLIPDEPEGSKLNHVCAQGLLAYYELATFRIEFRAEFQKPVFTHQVH